MDDFQRALHANNQKPCLCAIFRFEPDLGITRIVDVVGSGAQAQLQCDSLNERFAKVLGLYQWSPMSACNLQGKYGAPTELTVLRGGREESVRALRRPPWLRTLVERLDRWFVTN